MPLPSPASGADRRQHPRVPARGRVDTRITDAAQAQDVTIVDLSRGGFLLESTEPFTVGTIHQFRIALRDGRWMTMLTARSLHGRPQSDGRHHLTGFAFVEPLGDEARERVHALVENVTSVVSF
jgi:hypothetical protein